MLTLALFLNLFAITTAAQGADIRTNELTLRSPPAWVKRTTVEKVTDSIQMKLEWRIRRIEVFWHSSPASFSAAQNLGAQAVAVTKIANETATVHMGPQVTLQNYEQILSHELVHVIIFQKYKNSIPKWLEEGLANHLSKRAAVNYQWLTTQKFPADISELAHPFKGTKDRITYSYMASQAFAEMLNKKCDLQNLIRLSVERKMEDYIKRTCQITDMNKAFRDWVLSKTSKA